MPEPIAGTRGDRRKAIVERLEREALAEEYAWVRDHYMTFHESLDRAIAKNTFKPHVPPLNRKAVPE